MQTLTQNAVDTVAQDVLDHLLSIGLVDRESIVRADLRITVDQVRNQIIMVRRERDDGYFIKRILPSQPMAAETLAREAGFYQLVSSIESLISVRSIIPRFVHYAPERHQLTLQLIENSKNLSAFFLHNQALPIKLCAKVGKAIGTYSRSASNATSNDARSQEQIPWILTLPRAGIASGVKISGGNSQLLAMLDRYPEFREHLNALLDSWENRGLVHGDMKWENCIVSETKETPAKMSLYIIDWEIVGLGDPLWDVGSFMQSFFTMWILSTTAQADGTNGVEMLKQMQPGIKAFLDAFRESSGFTHDICDQVLRFAAARIIQTAFETMLTAQNMSVAAVQMLQLSSNIFSKPDEARQTLLGF